MSIRICSPIRIVFRPWKHSQNKVSDVHGNRTRGHPVLQDYWKNFGLWGSGVGIFNSSKVGKIGPLTEPVYIASYEIIVAQVFAALAKLRHLPVTRVERQHVLFSYFHSSLWCVLSDRSTMTGEVKKFKKSVSKIGTHNGTFHCDEVLAVAMLRMLPECEAAEVVRWVAPAVGALTDSWIMQHAVDQIRSGFDTRLELLHKGLNVFTMEPSCTKTYIVAHWKRHSSWQKVLTPWNLNLKVVYSI